MYIFIALVVMSALLMSDDVHSDRTINNMEINSMTNQKLKSRNISRKMYHFRKLVMERDNNQCQVCLTKTLLEVHHIIPLSKGGSWDIENGQTLCELCHLKMHGKQKQAKKDKPRTANPFNKLSFHWSIWEPMLVFIKEDAERCGCKKWRSHIHHMLMKTIESEGKLKRYKELCDKYNLYNQ